MHAHPQLEHDIQNRARWLADALARAAGAPDGLCEARDAIAKTAAATPPPIDQMTWFALQRVSAQTNLSAFQLTSAGQAVPENSLVWVSDKVEVNPDDAKTLAKSLLFVAKPEWNEAVAEQRAALNAEASNGERRPKAPGR